MELYLVRHIKPVIEDGVCYGQKDVPIGHDCINEHKKIIQELPIDFDAIYTSPLSRCKILSDQISPNGISDARLMELNFGLWDGLKWEDINREDTNKWTKNYISLAPPQGESLLDVVERFSEFIFHLKNKPYKKVIIITHAGIIRCAMHLLEGIPLDQIMMQKIAFGGIYKFETTLLNQ
jgi:alpha-ribazole phosphatase